MVVGGIFVLDVVFYGYRIYLESSLNFIRFSCLIMFVEDGNDFDSYRFDK